MSDYKQPTRINEAIEILRSTNDGDDLAPSDLSLVQAAVNGHLTAEGVDAFDKLHEIAIAGAYQKPWLFGIENLTIDHQGYVYWKRTNCVEHYTFYNEESRERLRTQAVELARRCLILEFMNITPTTQAILDDELFATP